MRFTEGKIRAICTNLQGLMSTTLCNLDDFLYVECGFKTSNTPPNEGWSPVTAGTRINGANRHAWFHKKLITPPSVAGKNLQFKLQTGLNDEWNVKRPQFMLYLNGEMVQGFDVNHKTCPLEFDTEYEMHLYYASGMMDVSAAFLPSLELSDPAVVGLYYDLNVPLTACGCLDQSDENYVRILTILDRAVAHLNLCDPKSEQFYESIKETKEYLYKELYEGICGNSTSVVNCIGHTHIDVAWLWTLAVTREKAQCSFATVLQLMKQYPEYKFMSSQPQLYQFVKEENPVLYEQIKQAIKDGRWEAEGSMWLEADCNLISGESMVRQILFGKRFMKEEFGVDNHILWLPDVFGYSAAMPQILKKSGIDKFVTSKISWNDHNQMPYDTFLWQGIDGTTMFTYFLTAQTADRSGKTHNNTTYNGYIHPPEILGTWRRYQQKHLNNQVINTFGHGDGGGGPSSDMLEQQRRLSYGLPGFPKTQISTAGEFLDIAEANFNKNCKELNHTPKWVGELYLEYHRGTYTTMAANKKGNRKSELLYQKAEALSVLEMLFGGSSYPQSVLNDGWRTILLNQFHDIIPGSSMIDVYKDSAVQYAEVLSKGTEIANQGLLFIAENIASNGGVLVYNPNGFECSDVVDCEGELLYAEKIPAFGWKMISPSPKKPTVEVMGRTVENKFYIMSLDSCGNITSLFDKEAQREVVMPGEKANQLQIFEDLPMQYDAWDISPYYKYKMWEIDEVTQFSAINEGIRAGFIIKKRFQKSTITQKIYLYSDIRRIDFETEVDWQESHLLLKAAFPLNLQTTSATYDIQFGTIERPTHENTDWDKAKFEVCAHKWADLSEDDYGVSLLNDCKYGYNAEGSTLKLSLLRSPKAPNPVADMGEHSFTYSLLPHSGDYTNGTVQAAYSFNQPMHAIKTDNRKGPLPAEFSFVSCDKEDIIIETVKKAEDSADIIVRMYEAYHRSVSATLKFGFQFREIYLCNLLEENETLLASNTDTLTLPIGTYEIITLKLIK